MRSAFRNPLNEIRHFSILWHRRIIDIESSTEKARRPIMKIHSEARYSTRYFRQEKINKGSSWRINIKVGWECRWKCKSRGSPQPHQKGDGGGGPRAVKAALVLMNYVNGDGAKYLIYLSYDYYGHGGIEKIEETQEYATYHIQNMSDKYSDLAYTIIT